MERWMNECKFGAMDRWMDGGVEGYKELQIEELLEFDRYFIYFYRYIYIYIVRQIDRKLD